MGLSLKDKSIKILTISGIPIKIDLSWFVILVLIVWNLAVDYYPTKVPSQSFIFYLWFSVLSALLLFASILLHEISHSLVAQRLGYPIKEITLFIFGGVAKMNEDPKTAEQEFVIAIAGPLMSFIIMVVFLGSYFLTHLYGGLAPIKIIILFFSNSTAEPPVNVLFKYLAIINFGVILFNIMPGLPLDGGRIFRALLWKVTGDVRSSTKIASGAGKVLGFLLIGMGILQIMLGIFGGVWLIMIGLFLYQAAKISYEQVYINSLISDLTVIDALNTKIVTAPSNITVREIANEYFLKFPHKRYLVMKTTNDNLLADEKGDSAKTNEDTAKIRNRTFIDLPAEIDISKILGFITLQDISTIPKSRWDYTTLENVINIRKIKPLAVNSRTGIKEALICMDEENANCILVMDERILLGTVCYEDIMAIISARAALL